MNTATSLLEPPNSTTTPEPRLLLQKLIGHQPATPSPRRNGKVARLPKATRDLLNRMLDDGLPARVIIDELGDAGAGLNPQNISNWVQGGYQDYLKHQETIARAKAQMELAVDLLRETADLDPSALHRACNIVAGLQLLGALREYGDQALQKLFQGNPAKYLTALNTVATMANSSIHLEKLRLKQEVLAALNIPPSNPIKPPQAPPENPTLPLSSSARAGRQEEAPSNPIKPPQAPPESPTPNPALPLSSSSSEAQGDAPSNPIKPPQAPPESPTPNPALPLSSSSSEAQGDAPSNPIKAHQAPPQISPAQHPHRLPLSPPVIQRLLRSNAPTF